MDAFKQNLEKDIENLENYVNGKYYDVNKLFPNIYIYSNSALLKRNGCYFAIGGMSSDDILKHKQQLIDDVFLSEFELLFPINSGFRKYLPNIKDLQKKMRYVNMKKSDGSEYTIIN